MNDDIFLYLYAHQGPGYEGARHTIQSPKNSKYFRLGTRNESITANEAGRNNTDKEREETQEPALGNLEEADCLVLQFSHGARRRCGIVLGCSENADIVLPRATGISRHHVAFAFNERNRPIVRDLGSKIGTLVKYNEQAQPYPYKNATWNLIRPKKLQNEMLILCIHPFVQFRLVVPYENVDTDEYVANVTMFRELQDKREAESILAEATIDSGASTRLPSGLQTPTAAGPHVIFASVLGSGAFGTVYYTWNATTDEEYVEKRPKRTLTKEALKTWKREADLNSKISHHHIVAFLGASFEPSISLKFEYIGLGSMEYCNAMSFSILESWQIIQQLSSALAYLHHSFTPSIVHRDIKPENILISQRDMDGIVVKFADFGLSKAGSYLETRCGTLKWAAPEIFSGEAYNSRVDIWCLGAVVLWTVCDLPTMPESMMTGRWQHSKWTTMVLDHATQHNQAADGKVIPFLVSNMLIQDPEERSTADYCQEEALREVDSILSERSVASTVILGSQSCSPSSAKPSSILLGIERRSARSLLACSVKA